MPAVPEEALGYVLASIGDACLTELVAPMGSWLRYISRDFIPGIRGFIPKPVYHA
jgi:hypothetical protein